MAPTLTPVPVSALETAGQGPLLPCRARARFPRQNLHLEKQALQSGLPAFSAAELYILKFGEDVLQQASEVRDSFLESFKCHALVLLLSEAFQVKPGGLLSV